MYRIILNSKGKPLTFDGFCEKLLSICKHHQDEGRASAFAFILYDFTNPTIAEILDNINYWRALDEISGRYLTVFSLHIPHKNRDLLSRNDGLQMLTSIPTHLNPSQASNVLLSKYFGNPYFNYPAILFFQVYDNNIIDSLIIELHEELLEKSFIELREYLGKAVDAITAMRPTEKGNPIAVFDELEHSVNILKTRNRVFRSAKILRPLGEFISSLIEIKSLW